MPVGAACAAGGRRVSRRSWPAKPPTPEGSAATKPDETAPPRTSPNPRSEPRGPFDSGSPSHRFRRRRRRRRLRKKMKYNATLGFFEIFSGGPGLRTIPPTPAALDAIHVPEVVPPLLSTEDRSSAPTIMAGGAAPALPPSRRGVAPLSVLLLVLHLFASSLLPVAGWNVLLSASTQASGARGGEAFDVQPSLIVTDKSGNLLTDFAGRATVEVQAPLGVGGRGAVWREGSPSSSADSSSSELAVEVSDGAAVFAGLGIDAAGVGYRPTYVLRDEHGLILASVEGDEFDVSVGEAHDLGFVARPETAHGGIPFGSQPVAAVRDRGGNVATDASEGTVTVSLETGPAGSVLRCASDGSGFVAPVANGLSAFSGLYLDEAASHYSLRFSYDLPLAGGSEVISDEFSVGVGPAAQLHVTSDASDGRVTGGKAFSPQPRVEVRDAGGNVLVDDSSSAVRATFYANPSRGTLIPESGTIEKLQRGVVQFRSLAIDKAGVRYRLTYEFLQYDHDKARLEETSVVAHGSYFDVEIGPPHRLSVLQPPWGGWAGNQPFPVQPKVALLDAGGNVVLGDSTSAVTAHVTPSLAHGSRVIIDTSNDPVPTVAEVAFAPDIREDERLTYGPGDVVRFDVVFSQEVALYETVDGGTPPRMTLNLIDGGGPEAVYAELVPTQQGSLSRRVTFEYRVEVGHSHTELDYASSDSFRANDFSVEDAFGRSADLTLPATGLGSSLSASRAIGISDARPVVESVSGDLPTGEYGAGHEATFVVSFDREVAVAGRPGLPLNVQSAVAVIDVSTTGAVGPGSYFNILHKGDKSEPIPWNGSAAEVRDAVESLPSVTGGVCVSRAPSPNSLSAGGFRWAIRFEDVGCAASEIQVDGAGLDFSGAGGALSVDLLTTSSVLSGWVDGDGSMSVGSMCTARSAWYSGGSGTKDIEFNYKVLQGDATTGLDIADGVGTQLQFPTIDDSMSLLVNSPGPSPIHVDPNIGTVSLPMSQTISVDTTPPVVTSITPQESTTPSGTYAVGDSLFFELSFDKAVEVDIGLELAFNVDGGVAWYISGSGTQDLLLEYVVEEDDVTPMLDFRDSTSLAPQNTEGGRSPVAGHVRRKSQSPITDADLSISHIVSIAASHSIVVDGERPQLLDVSFDVSNHGSTFERGDVLSILVQFTAPVVVNESSPPTLGLLVGGNERWATYSSGSGSSTLRFVYEVLLGDSSTPLEFFYTTICDQDKDCGATEGLVVRLSATLELDADLESIFSDQGVPIAESSDVGVTTDTSSAPVTTISSITTSKSAGTYGVGEIVDIQVTFTDVVFLPGSMPTLFLNTGNFAPYFSGKGSETLTFRLISTETDAISKLDWALDSPTASAIACSEYCSIVNANGIDADVSFHALDPLEPAIAFDPSPPVITSIYTDKAKSPHCHPLCTYTVGEEIDILVTFDRPVVVDGKDIFLALDVGGDASTNRAVYVPSRSSDNELVFLYTVADGHSTEGASLNHVCTDSICALQLGGTTDVKGAASIPTLDADLTLPPSSEYGLSGDELNPVIVDTSGNPQVIGVSSALGNGAFVPGDIIEIAVQFDRDVAVSGDPFLTLDVGKPEAGIATYKAGSGTSILLFEYEVGIDHIALDLEYIDKHSLYLGFDGVNSGTIKQASTNPTVDANVDLVPPTNTGSLASNSDVQIDSRIPFITLIAATPGQHSTGDEILIQVQFSRPVVVTGKPLLALNAGILDRVAEYKLQADDRSLLFSYIVQLGDETESLDYWSDNELLPSSTISLDLNGGSIKLQGTHPILDADLHINPIDGFLDGGKEVEATEGVALFRDLKIGQRGRNFRFWFRSSVPKTGGELQVAETVKIEASIEYEVRGDLIDRDPGDLYGSAVSLSGDMLAVGAPGKLRPTSEVQVLTVYSEAAEEEHEVQIISTELNTSEAVKSSQEFSTCANSGATVGGMFTLTYHVDGIYEFASPLEFDSDISAEQLKASLERELNLNGLINTSKIANPNCESSNAWTWGVTFLDSSNGVGILETDGDLLTGDGSHISQSVPTRDVNMLAGTFRLVNPFTGLTSRSLAYDASGNAVKDAIEEDLGISVLSVQTENMNPDNEIAELGRRWTIIFSHHVGEFGVDTNVPQLEAVSDGLLGEEAQVWTHTGFEGRGTLSGSFALSFRGSELSTFVPHDSSEEEIATALESLDSINAVSVSNRRTFSNEVGKSGCSWTITFDSVNKLTEYGWLLDPGGASSHGNLPTLEVTSRLIGWKSGYLVRSETGRGEEDTQAQWMRQQKGDDGTGTGMVDIFRRARETWRREATVFASDHGSNDAFGASVSISDKFVLIGAPSKIVDGLPEQQTMTCVGVATGGSFTVEFRGFKSSAIPFDATLVDIQNAIVGPYGGTDKVHTMPMLLLESGSEWDGVSSGFCEESEQVALITFITPDGGGLSTVEKRSGDIEMLTVDTSNLGGASIVVSEVRVGTRAPMGNDLVNSEPTGKQSGSAYLFKRNQSCSYCEPVWNQLMKFTPMDGLDNPTDAAQFGWSSVFLPGIDEADSLAIVGSPGFHHGSGKVYLFHINTAGSWLLLDSLSDRNWNHDRVRGGRFGTSLAAMDDTVLVGAPGHSNGKGAVYVFRRSAKGKPFLASQAIYGPDDLKEGENFGHSIALFDNKAVICAPLKTTDAIHIGTSPQGAAQVGACFVYMATSSDSGFLLDQQLVPSNVLPFDRFGWSVAMSGNRIIVGQVEEATSEMVPPRPVQVVRTFCEHRPCKHASGSKFRLRWIDSAHWTPYMSASTSANQMRDAIESSLLSGAASVSRSMSPDEDGGHMWHITFDSYDATLRDVNKIPIIQCEEFVTASLSCHTHIEHDIPRKIRGKAHLFDFDESSGTWTEQSFLFPWAPQKQDFLAHSVAIDGNVAVAGAPNRELLNDNSGAALIHDIRYLNFRFSDGTYSLVEGDSIDIGVERSSSDDRQVVSMRTMDPNAESDFQHYINELFSLRSLDISSHDKTPVELLTENTALGRSQYYGSTERRSRFIVGMYDYQGVNDYELLAFEGQFQRGEDTISTRFRTNDDSIVESPGEHVTVQFNLKGMFPSQLGRLKADVHISENSDGVSPEGNEQYQVLWDPNQEESARMGAAIDIDRAAGMIVVGSDEASAIGANGYRLKEVGRVNVFKRSSPGNGWDAFETLSPPVADIKENMKFGQSVAIHKAYGRAGVTILIGAPGVATAYVYVYEPGEASWTLQAKLAANDARLSSEDGFGGRGAIALLGDMAFVGSSTMEQVYVFRRSYVAGEGVVRWDSYAILRSGDYDFDVYGHNFSIKHRHLQGFGTALAGSKRTVLVGAPYADYGNRGDANAREHYNTDGIHNKGLGLGKVYSFYSQPHVQIVILQSDEKIAAGTFVLMLSDHQGIEEDISGVITHDASPDVLKVALEEMKTVGEVNVNVSERIEDGSYEMKWRVSFMSNFEDSQPVLIPRWYGNGCDSCVEFKVSVLSEVVSFITVTATHSHLPFVQEGELQPRDVTSTDLFGASIALDGPQAIIGSMHSAAKARTTWDFETGDLQGWSATGTAFQKQPTFGDNSKFRAVYEGHGTASSHTSGEPQSSRLDGRYFVATYDQRSGEEGNYQAPSADYSLGSTQGDGPTGMLTSDPFIILGSTISLKVGGGCDHLISFVELLVDGFPSLRATGKCAERMDRVHWDVTSFQNRAGQIRIVDGGSDKWHHINVDDIDFGWSKGGTCQYNNFGQCAEGGGALPKSGAAAKQHYSGKEESSKSGAAYAFFYECSNLDFGNVSPSNSNCAWKEQERLVASDKRQGNMFGAAVSVDNESGMAMIGSPKAASYGFYQEPVSVHPHSNSTIKLPIPADHENLMRSGVTYSATAGNVRLIDQLIYEEQFDVEEASKFTENAGAVYVFLREPARYGPMGEIVQEPYWRTTEHSKLAPPDAKARDNFGFSVALDGVTSGKEVTAVMGATGRDGHVRDGGGGFVFDMEWVRVKFTQVEFVALESDRLVKIFVERDLSWSDGRFSVGYSTSDLTAVGVDTLKYDECMGSSAPDRDGCGDYEQSSGEVTFNAGEQHAYFTIRIIDDLCIENHLEYVQLNLHQIGGSPLRGEDYRSQLRIDDDDFEEMGLSMNCTHQSQSLIG
ncbi:hypothetical protein ACHAWF_018570 [Thalassiosira exigua]